jgi:hypothetical protein
MINKKAQLSGVLDFDIFTFIVFCLIVVVFFAGWIYANGLLNNAMHNAGLNNEVNAGQPGYTNMTLAADLTFGKMYQSMQALHMVALVYILSLAVVIIITNALIKRNPIWFFAYILISLCAILFAPQVSNAYGNLLASGLFAGELNNFTASNFILLHLPIIVLIISVLGGLFMFVNLIKGEGSLQ